jgi:hypothetical protein
MGAIAEGFAAFAQPLLEQTDGSDEQVNKAFSLTQLCFNLALLPPDHRDSMLSEMRPALNMDEREFDEFRHLIVEPMIQRHHEMFPMMHQHGSTNPIENDPLLEPYASIAPPAETPAVTDRYAPCPCNSGRKFKFCCGKKGR